MTYFDNYKKRLGSSGNTESDAIKNASADFINNSFADSPTYKIVKIEDVDTEARVITGKDSSNMNLLLKPYKSIAIGSNVVIDGNNWIALDVIEKILYPKALIRRCNESLKWLDESESLIEVPCSVTTLKYNATNDAIYSLEVADGNIFIYAQWNDNTRKIKHSQRFVIGSQVYEIVGIDDLRLVIDNIGVVEFSARLSNKVANDNLTDGLADNSTLKTGSGGDKLW